MIIAINVLLLLLVAIAIFFSASLVLDVILIGLFSFLMTLFYTFTNAPDVAITEAAVGVVLGTVFALSVLLIYKDHTVKNNNIVGFIILVAAFISLLPLVRYFVLFGLPAANEVSNYYIENTISRLGFTNIVTGILASFRGFDTFIETIVIFTAANSVYMLIGKDHE